MSAEVHELYKELSAALNDLSNDMVKGLVSLRAVAGDNRADIQKLESRLDARVGELQSKIERLQRAEGASEQRIAAIDERVRRVEVAAEKREEAKAAVELESTKGRWLFWVAVAGGGFGLLSTVAQIVAAAMGWRSG